MGRFQSTHPRGVRLFLAVISITEEVVSIHAPAWGATWITRRICLDTLFQSTHPRGVRRRVIWAWSDVRGFQSTHPRGVRHRDKARQINLTYVSIHAPAWGATGQTHKDRSGMTGFNPRTRVGCDARRAVSINISSGFNPRTRVGCDHVAAVRRAWTDPVSIHAPAWGATLSKIVSSRC